MKLNLTAGYLFLLGLPAMGIEAPGTSTPIPPQPIQGETFGKADKAVDKPVAPAFKETADDNRADDNGPTISDIDDQDEDNSDMPPVPQFNGRRAAPAVAGAYLGIGGAEVPSILAEHLKLPEGQGIVIRTLDPEGPAAKAGLTANDVITRVDGKGVSSQNDLRQIVGSHKPGDDVAIDFINKGESKTIHATLASGRPSSLSDTAAIDQLMLQGLPPEQAQRLREALERNLRAFEDADRDLSRQQDITEQLQRGMQDRIQKLMGGAGSRRGIDIHGSIGGANGKGMNFKSSSSVRLLDDKGTIELKSEDDSKTVRALDKDGKVQWEGPYNTDEDKKAMPDEIRDRVEKLSPDLDFKGSGFRLNLGPRR